MKLHLGSAGNRRLGFHGVDRIDDPENVDQVVDLNQVPWPWEDDSIEMVYADNVVEHLCPMGPGRGQLNIVATMSEIYRVLQPGGTVEVIVPSTDGRGAWQDPTHVTYWNRNTFLYFIKGEDLSPEGEAMGFPQFVANRRDLGVTDTESQEHGIVWTVARLMKPLVESNVEGVPEGTDFDAETVTSYTTDGGDAPERSETGTD